MPLPIYTGLPTVRIKADEARMTWDEFHRLIDLKHIRRVPQIENVIYNNPATVVLWSDGTKTVVKANGEEYVPEIGLAMAIAKKALGNQGKYYNEFKRWLPKN